MQIKKPSKTRLKKSGFKLVLNRKRVPGNVFVNCIDKGWFKRHSSDYLSHPKVYKIYESDKQVLIYMEV